MKLAALFITGFAILEYAIWTAVPAAAYGLFGVLLMLVAVNQYRRATQ